MSHTTLLTLSESAITDVEGEKAIAVEECISEVDITDKNPIEKYIKLQQGRVIRILNLSISQLKLSICLSRIVRKDPCVLLKYFPLQEVEYIHNVCRKFTGEHTSSRLLLKSHTCMDKKTSIASNRTILGMLSVKPDIVDPHMARVIELLWDNKSLRLKLLNKYEGIEKNDLAVLVNHLVDLKEISESRFLATAEQERKKERDLANAWLMKRKYEEELKMTRIAMQQEPERLRGILENKNFSIEESTRKLEELKANFKDQIRRKTLESEKTLAERVVESQTLQAEIALQAKAATQQYETLLSQNMAMENDLRKTRTKIEMRVSSWLSKYDADIGERSAELEQLTEGYNKEKNEMRELQNAFNEQEKEYTPLFQQKEEEDQEEFERKAYAFILNRSARRIQRWWKSHVQRVRDRRQTARERARKRKAEKEAGRKKGGAKKK